LRVSDRPPSAYAYCARRAVQTLRLLAERPRSAPELAEVLQVKEPAARRLIAGLVGDGLLEEDPDSLRHRHRIAASGYDFALVLVAAGLRELERRERESLAAGQLLMRYRRSRGLSRADFAAVLDLSPSTLEKIERGQRKIDGDQVVAFASCLGVDVLDLLTLRRSDTRSGG
jgi:plasmid maintenance system antidote protein VapI